MTRPPATVRTRDELARLVGGLRERGTIGFVPTMGALHEGHLSLVRASVEECAATVVSIFVNPTQFGPGEDLDSYPREWESDREKLAGVSADLVFLPAAEEIYPPGSSTIVEVEGLSRRLCGASRPGHFRGVATVVWKLLRLVDPTCAYFGAKDAQQVVIIRRMVEDLFGRWAIRSIPTIREEDGLAMSSRNARLGREDRLAAPVLYAALRRGRALLVQGERESAAVVAAVREVLDREPLAGTDYVKLVSLRTLEPVDEACGEILIAVAARVGPARLIDNLTLRIGDSVEEILP